MSASLVCPNPEQRFNNWNAVLEAPIFAGVFQIDAGVQEKRVDVPVLDNLKTITADTCGMKCMPATVTEFLVDQFKANPNVRAVLVGESEGVHHVWILIDEWSVEQRKAVYAVQKEILQRLKEFNFDFYVLDIPEGSNPQEVVSEIPVAYHRV
jgi:hypothetical protein